MKRIEVLGMGCPKCEKLGKNAKKAAEELGIEFELVKIKDLNVITGYGVMITPALAIDGLVKSSGKVLSVDEIKEILK